MRAKNLLEKLFQMVVERGDFEIKFETKVSDEVGTYKEPSDIDFNLSSFQGNTLWIRLKSYNN
jgi:hypothetical protein